MPGLYDNLNFNNGEFVNTYAGTPLKEITDTASELSNRHYSNLARLNQLQLLREQTKSKLLPGAKSYVDEQFNDIDLALEEIAKSGGENSTAKVSAIANRFMGDQGILRASQTASDYQKFLDTQRTLKAQGKNPIYNKRLEQEYLNSGVIDQETGKVNQIYNDPFKLTAEPYIEPVPEIDKLWEVIKPDAIESQLGKRDYLMLSKLIPQAIENGAIDMPLFYEMTKKSGISPDKIKMFTNAVKRQVDSSDLGKQIKNFETLTPQQLDDLILERGLMRVYSNTDRQVVQSNITDDLLKPKRVTPVESPLTIRNPLPSKLRQKFDPGFSTDDITDNGNVNGNILDRFIHATHEEMVASNNKVMIIPNLKRKIEKAKQQGNNQEVENLTNQLNEVEKQTKEYETDPSVRNKELNKEMFSYMRTAIESTGQDTEAMDDKQIQAIAANPNGQAVLKNYLNNIAGQRYHAPYISNIVDEKIRQANEDFLRGNFSQREFIDMSTGEHYTGLKNENGEVQDGLLELSKALQDKKAIVEGTIDPKHILTQLAPDGDNFVRALRVQIPFGTKGEMKEFLISQPAESTSVTDINENALYVLATEAPGRWSDVGNKVKVLTPATEEHKEMAWRRYGQGRYEIVNGVKVPLMKEEFMSNDIVVLDIDGVTIPFPDYATAAQYLTEKKRIKLTRQKQK